MKCKKILSFTARQSGRRSVGNNRIFRSALCLLLSLFMGTAYAQEQVPALDLKNVTIRQVLDAIEKETGYVFLISDDANGELNTRVSIHTQRGPVSGVLDAAFGSTSLGYGISGSQVTIFRRQRPTTPPAGTSVFTTVTGTVRDNSGNAVPGVAVQLQESMSIGTTTDASGNFSLDVPPTRATLVFSFLGMETQVVPVVSGKTVYDIVLMDSSEEIEAVSVVSTGLYVRDRVTYTGNISTFSGEELLTVSNRNILESLSVLDPSFIMVENITAGSNPNSMKSIEIRGQSVANLSAVTDEFSEDPNQPLFILNGVEVPYSRIHDLDPYRIEAINVLKDAGATAIYGAKGANGVLVIETVKPKPGEYTISYSGRFSVDAPDLSVYNMMNSAEKLEFERLAGKFYDSTWANTVGGAMKNVELQKLYDHLYTEVASGVDTYWLSEPVRTAFSNQHSVTVNGGTEELALTVGVNYGNVQGVMKNNNRDRWGTSATINYRLNKFIIINDTDINGFKSRESNYGSFSDWVNASPYFRKYNEDGTIGKWLQTKDGLGSASSEEIGSFSPINNNVPNPLWNATLRSKDETEYLYLNNSLQMQYDILSNLRARGTFTVRRTQQQTTRFKDPDHTDFADNDRYKRGTYYNREAKSTYYYGQFSLNYGQTFDKHTVGANAYVQLAQEKNQSITTEAEGYPRGSDGSPNLANSYKSESSPGYGWDERRSVGALFAANYSYDLRYLLDVTVRTDGATTFGSNKVFKPFWSVGLGWNLHYENFAKSWDAIDMLKLTTTYGTTGNQNIGKVVSNTVYQYFIDSNIFGQGSAISGLGAPNLPWAVNKKLDVKLEARMLRGRFSVIAAYYYDKTDPQIVDVNQIPSTGVSSYPMDIGYLKQNGVELNLRFSPIYNLKERIIWSITLNGSYKDSKFGGFNNTLQTLNKTMLESNAFTQYRDGYSPNTIWAVKSWGIDPANGQEVFENLDGTVSYIYDFTQAQAMGSTRPDLEGNIYSNFRYKNFDLAVSLNYSFGSDIYNSALYEKVENITKTSLERNQDKRALYDRWKEVGDVTKYRSISILTDDSPITSRYIQKNNYLRAVSINLGYELSQSPWLRRNLGVERMKFNFTMDELFRVETSRYERGYNTPFARQFTLAVSIGF